MLEEKDFVVLRRPLESGRQSTNSLGGILIVAIPFQALILWLEYDYSMSSIYPYVNEIFVIHLWISGIISVLSILYALPFIYIRSQKVQYLLSIIVSQNIGAISIYILAMMLVSEKARYLDHGQSFLSTFTLVTLLIGTLLFLATFVRFFYLLHKGKYRAGSRRDKIRKKYESKSLIPVAIIGGSGVAFIIQFLFRNFYFASLDTFFLVTLGLLIFYTMIFVLPEQLVILYCKYRFKSFNYSRDGRLYDFGEGEQDSSKSKSD